MQSTAFLLAADLEGSGWLENLQPVIECIATAGIFIVPPPRPGRDQKESAIQPKVFPIIEFQSMTFLNWSSERQQIDYPNAEIITS